MRDTFQKNYIIVRMELKIKIPKNWDSITVGRFAELYPVLTSDGKLVERVPALISVLSGLPLDDIKTISIGDYKRIAKHLEFLNEFQGLKEMPDTFKIDGQRYHINTNINKMTGAQYMDLMHFLKECNNNDFLIIQNLHKILSCVIVPDERKAFGWKKGKYNGERHQEISEAIRDKMSIKYAYPIALFFWTISHELIATMKDYGNNQLAKAQEILKEVEKDLRDGDGT